LNLYIYDRYGEYNTKNKKCLRIAIKPWLLYKRSENTIRRSEAVNILRKEANTMSSGKITQR
jgi:hypothetical protein